MSKNVNRVIGSLTVIAVILMVVSSGESVAWFLRGTSVASLLNALSWPNSILFNLSVGYITSVIFWFIVVYLPDKARRRLLRDTLAMRYREFKEEVVQIMIWASGTSETIDVIHDLASDHLRFKEYFGSGSDRWYAVLNGIQASELRMRELLLAMKMFSDEVGYVLNNLAIDDPSVHSVLKRLNENILRLRESESDLYERVKEVGGFLWRLLARWDFVNGQVEEDIVERIVRRI